MIIEKYPNHCSQCGAPLTQKQGKTYCEYCGQVYFHSSIDSKTENNEEPMEEKPAPPADMEEDFPRSLSTIKDSIETNTNDAGKEPTQKTPDSLARDDRALRVIIVSFIIFILLPLLTKIDDEYDKSNSSRESISKELTLLEYIYKTEYDSVAYPSASYENLNISTAIVLEYANANMLVFSLFVYNTSERNIDTSSGKELLEINSLMVSSDQNDEFICTLEKVTWRYDVLEKYEFQQKGLVRCTGSLSPKSSLIDIDFDMPNWGSSHLQIPIYSNDEALNTRIGLWLHGEEHKINIVLLSEKPQLVWVKKSDITISDDRGNTLLLDDCRPPTSQSGEGAYLLTLANDDGILITTTAHFLYLAECYYDEPFPSEINTLRASFKTTSGKTFTSQAVINKSDGWIYFDNE